MDFTVKMYRKLLNALIDKSYTFQTFHQFLEKPAERVIILRHDVDAMPGNSLRFAEIQHEQFTTYITMGNAWKPTFLFTC